jgi:hypothetical protein
MNPGTTPPASASMPRSSAPPTCTLTILLRGSGSDCEGPLRQGIAPDAVPSFRIPCGRIGLFHHVLRAFWCRFPPNATIIDHALMIRGSAGGMA